MRLTLITAIFSNTDRVFVGLWGGAQFRAYSWSVLGVSSVRPGAPCACNHCDSVKSTPRLSECPLMDHFDSLVTWCFVIFCFVNNFWIQMLGIVHPKTKMSHYGKSAVTEFIKISATDETDGVMLANVNKHFVWNHPRRFSTSVYCASWFIYLLYKYCYKDISDVTTTPIIP